jgi:hypothetical protein
VTNEIRTVGHDTRLLRLKEETIAHLQADELGAATSPPMIVLDERMAIRVRGGEQATEKWSKQVRIRVQAVVGYTAGNREQGNGRCGDSRKIRDTMVG